MYAKTNPEEVFNILQKYNASYIILEDSICLAHRERCSLPDIMDLSNGHVRMATLLLFACLICNFDMDHHPSKMCNFVMDYHPSKICKC